MRSALLLGALISVRAWAIDDCMAGDKSVSMDNGNTTRELTGTIRCVDRDTKEVTRTIPFVNGQQHGRETRTFRSGDSMEQDYKAGKRHGEYRKFEGGKLIEVSHYVDDHEQGEFARYSPKTGKVTRKGDRREPDGASTWQDFTEAGQLAEAGCGLQSSYEAGLRDCQWKGPSPLVFFHESGQKRAVIELSGGLRQGVTTTFDREGSKSTETRYGKGLRDGLFVDFEEGKPRRSTQYVAGQKAGDDTEFFRDGEKKKVTTWKDERAVREQEFFQNGAKKFERVRDGELATETRYDDDGRLVDRAHLRGYDQEGLHEQFLPDGGLSLTETYAKDRLQGRRQVFFDDGKPAEDSTWDHGRVSARKSWDADGGLVEDEAFYEDGSRKKKKP